MLRIRVRCTRCYVGKIPAMWFEFGPAVERESALPWGKNITRLTDTICPATYCYWWISKTKIALTPELLPDHCP